jgi:hypothetical protein
MYLIRFKEQDFDLLAVQELFYTRDRKEAEDLVEDLNSQLQKIIEACRKEHILGCVEIPELKIFILSTHSIVKIEMVEVDRIPAEIDRLTFTHLLS